MKIHKLNHLGQIIETIELEKQFVRPGNTYLVECEDKSYILTNKNIKTVESKENKDLILK